MSRLPIVYANVEYSFHNLLEMNSCIVFSLQQLENLRKALKEDANVHERKACLSVRNEVPNQYSWTQEFLFVVALLN